MEKEPRKATDVILDIESKLDTVLNIIKSQDLVIKVLSNKLNTLMEKIDKQPVSAPKFTVETVNATNPFIQPISVDVSKQIPISSDLNLPLEEFPTGFRRTSRPETFSGDNAYLKKPNKTTEPKFPIQLPKMQQQTDIIVPPTVLGRSNGQTLPPPINKENTNIVQNAIPIMQRVVDANGKSVFLADVEIIDLSTMQQVFKNRTNGTGKWMASLPIGAYRVSISKRESLSKDKLEAAQDIQVDGSHSPLELPLMIIKK